MTWNMSNVLMIYALRTGWCALESIDTEIKIPDRENTGNMKILEKHRDNTGNLKTSEWFWRVTAICIHRPWVATAVRGGGGQNTITDCVILFIKSIGKNINFAGKTQGKCREFKLEKGVGTMLAVIISRGAYMNQNLQLKMAFMRFGDIKMYVNMTFAQYKVKMWHI